MNFKFLLIIMFIFVNQAYAKNVGVIFTKSNYSWMESSKYKSKLKSARKRSGERKVANSINEKMMSSEYRQFRDDLLNIKTSIAYASLLEKLESKYKAHPHDLKFVAARMLPVHALRGILYRLRPIMELEDVTHSYFLTVVRRIVAQMKLFFPYDHSEAIFDYFAKPYMENGKVVSSFKNVFAFQKYVIESIYPLMATSASRISNMDFSREKIIWDNKIMNGSESFQDNIARFRVIGEAERSGTLFRLHRGMAFVNRFVAYNQNKLMEYTKEMGKLYGVDGFFSEVDGAPSYKRVKIANQSKFKSLFVLTDNGAQWMKQSFSHVKESIKYLRLIYEELKDRPASSFQRINPIRVSSWEREITSGLDTLEAIVNGPTELRSPITGEVIQVNLPEFYNNPPHDLKQLLPIAWELGDKELDSGLKTYRKDTRRNRRNRRNKSQPKKLKSFKVKYRNYYWGRPTAWNSKGYKRYFPSIKNDKDIARHMRIFRQSLGASTIGTPMTQFNQ